MTREIDATLETLFFGGKISHDPVIWPADPYRVQRDGCWYMLPNYTGNDQDAWSLLKIIIEEGYTTIIEHTDEGYICDIEGPSGESLVYVIPNSQLSMAICASVLEWKMKHGICR